MRIWQVFSLLFLLKQGIFQHFIASSLELKTKTESFPVICFFKKIRVKSFLTCSKKQGSVASKALLRQFYRLNHRHFQYFSQVSAFFRLNRAFRRYFPFSLKNCLLFYFFLAVAAKYPLRLFEKAFLISFIFSFFIVFLCFATEL